LGNAENHTVDFRESAAFADWRAIVGPSLPTSTVNTQSGNGIRLRMAAGVKK
jgi:hypothetical protein